MKREVIRVEPLSTWLEKWNAPASPVTRGNGMVFVSGLPPFDPDTGEAVAAVAIERQTELVLAQMKLCLETAGTSLENVMKCNVYCSSAKHFPAVNAIYARYFPVDPPARKDGERESQRFTAPPISPAPSWPASRLPSAPSPRPKPRAR